MFRTPKGLGQVKDYSPHPANTAGSRLVSAGLRGLALLRVVSGRLRQLLRFVGKAVDQVVMHPLP